MNQPGMVGSVEFDAQKPDKHIQVIVPDLALGAPDGLDQACARHYASGRAHQVLDDCKLGAREIYGGFSTPRLVRLGIDGEIGIFELRRPGALIYARPGAKTGEQNVERERLGEVVVGARSE